MDQDKPTAEPLATAARQARKQAAQQERAAIEQLTALATAAWQARKQAAQQERAAIEQLTADAGKLADSVRQLAHIIKVQEAKIQSLERENSELKQKNSELTQALLRRAATESGQPQKKGDAP
jgi:uncharacterized protein (DUF3084 family)